MCFPKSYAGLLIYYYVFILVARKLRSVVCIIMNLLNKSCFSILILGVTGLVSSQAIEAMSLKDICNFKKCIKKCCDVNSAMTRDNVTGEIFCDLVNISLRHPFLKVINDTQVLYKQSCNISSQYVLHASLDEDITVFENVTLHVPKFKAAVPLFNAKDFCFDHFDGEPGVLVCIDMTSKSRQNITTYIGKFYENL